MLDRTKNLLIGLFVVAALGVVVYILLFLHPTTGNEEQVLHVRFSDIDKVSVGTRVLFAGHPVGEVTAIREVPNARSREALHNKEVYIYELTLRIDSSIRVFSSDEISARTSGLLGEKSVSITPKVPPYGTPMILVTNKDILYATPPPTVDEAIRNFNTIAQAAKAAIGKVNEQLDIMKRRHLWENIAGAAKNIREITESLNQPEELRTIVKNVTEFSDGLVTLKNRVLHTWTSVDEVLAKTRRGEGTLGRLFMNEDIYLQVTAAMNKAQTLMDDINHYGLLFQNDPAWQRLRARRMNLLAKLSTPAEFHNYFNDEINQISTSLSRVSMVLNEVSQPDCLPVVSSPEFVQVFADLLRRIEGLEKEIKMYDQQVVEERERELNRSFLPLPCCP